MLLLLMNSTLNKLFTQFFHVYFGNANLYALLKHSKLVATTTSYSQVVTSLM